MDGIEFLHLLPDVALAEGNVMHGHLQVGVPQRFHDCKRICSRHAHLRSEGVTLTVDVNSQEA